MHCLDVRAETYKALEGACGDAPSADQLGASAATCPAVRQHQQQQQLSQPADLNRSASCPEPSPPPPAMSPAPSAALPYPLSVAATLLPDRAVPAPYLPHHSLSPMVPATRHLLSPTRTSLPGTCSGHASRAAPNTAPSLPAATSLLAVTGSPALPCGPPLPPQAAGPFQGLSRPAEAPQAPKVPAPVLLPATGAAPGPVAPLAPPTAPAARTPAAACSPGGLGTSVTSHPHQSGEPCGGYAGMATGGGRKRASLPMPSAEQHAGGGGGLQPGASLLQHVAPARGALPYAPGAAPAAPTSAAAGSAGGGVDTITGKSLAARLAGPDASAAEADTSPRPRKRQAHGVSSDGCLVAAGPEGPLTGSVPGAILPPGSCTAIGAAWVATMSPSL